MTTMDLGVALPHFGRYASREAIARMAQEAERLGLASLWVQERMLRPTHPRTPYGGRPGPMPEAYKSVYDPIETLTYAAAVTERIRLGTSVIDALFHVPAVLARRLATLDQLSGGRVVAGLGQGWSADEFAAANVPMKRRGAGLEEFVAALRAAWGPDPVSFAGRFYHIPESELGPKPVQPGGPPVLLGGYAPAAVERAGRIADGYNGSARSWELLEGSLRLLRQGAQAAGRDPDRLLIVLRSNTVIGAPPPAEPRGPLQGSVAQIVEDLARLREMGVGEVFFDMNFAETPVDDQLRRLEELRAALG